MQDLTFTEPADGDANRGWALVAVCWAFATLALCSTILRVWVRSRLTHNMGSDDWVMVVAMCTTLIGAAFITAEVDVGGLGQHMYYLTMDQKREFTAIGWADWIQTWITLGLTKISICLFLLRIVDTRPFKLFLYGMIVFLSLFSAVFVFLFFGVCRPLKAYWDVDVQGAVCFSQRQIRNIVIAQGALSIFTDLICAAFPIFFLRKLQVPMRTKVALCTLMGLGVITLACCVVRTAISGEVADKDTTWDIVPNIAWRLPEVNIGIVCANAPILRPLYLFFRGKLEPSMRSGRAYSHPTGASRSRFNASGRTRGGGSGGNEKHDRYAGSTAQGTNSDGSAKGLYPKKMDDVDDSGNSPTDVALELGLPATNDDHDEEQGHRRERPQTFERVREHVPRGDHYEYNNPYTVPDGHAIHFEKIRREAWE